MKIAIDRLDKAALEHIRKGLRDYDRRELEAQGYGDESYLAHLEQPYSYALKLDGEPLACGGAVPFGARLFFWGFGTDLADRHMLQVHKISTGFLSWIGRVEWQRLPSVLVWEGHAPSLRWLARLGFGRTAFEARGVNGERLFLLERAW